MSADIRKLMLSAVPRFLEGFAVVGTTVTSDDGAIAFELACGACGTRLFRLQKIFSLWKEGEPASGIGVAATCAGCGREHTLFDGTVHGFDGEHGHLDFLKGERSLQPFDGEAARLRVDCTYNNPVEDLIADSEATGRSPVDFFDWFHVFRMGEGAQDWQHLWEYECA